MYDRRHEPHSPVISQNVLEVSMKVWSVATVVLVLSVGVAAQGPPAKGNTGKSAIAVTLGSLGCSTAVGTDAFEVLSWSWGASNPGDLSGGGGGGAGKPTVSDLNLLKGFDACSPALFGAVVTGKAFPTLTLTASNKDGTTTTVTLSDVRVSSWQASGNSTSDAAVESASFAFSKVCLADGASSAKFCFDLSAGKTF
jgi:type VI protein secretion system component Hcp